MSSSPRCARDANFSVCSVHVHRFETTLFQVREVFEELGLQGEVLEESCKVVGSSDDTLLEFMKVTCDV